MQFRLGEGQPHGLPLTAQALAYARTAQLREFTPAGPRQAPATFPIYDVVSALGRGEPARRVAAAVALQEFMAAPARMARQFRAQLREMVTAGDHPSGATLQAYIDRFLITPGEADFGWREIFAVHDPMTAESQLVKSYFKVLSITSGIVFERRLPGEPAKFKSITSSEATVEYLMWGGGVSIERVWWDDQDYLQIGDLLSMFRADYYYRQAAYMYGLITALSTDYNYSTGADLVAKINGACAHIIRALQGKGYAVNANSTFVLAFPPEQWGNIDAVLAVQSQEALTQTTSKTRLKYRCVPIPTVHIPTSGGTSGIYVILPKNNLKAGIRMDLTLFGNFNVASYTDDIAGFGRDAGVVGDSNQIRRITI